MAFLAQRPTSAHACLGAFLPPPSTLALPARLPRSFAPVAGVQYLQPVVMPAPQPQQQQQPARRRRRAAAAQNAVQRAPVLLPAAPAGMQPMILIPAPAAPAAVASVPAPRRNSRPTGARRQQQQQMVQVIPQPVLAAGQQPVAFLPQQLAPAAAPTFVVGRPRKGARRVCFRACTGLEDSVFAMMSLSFLLHSVIPVRQYDW